MKFFGLCSNKSDQDEGNIQTHEDDVVKFGYKKQLYRTLNLFSTFGLAFSYISPVVGVYTLFSNGICTGGPSYIWGLPIVVFGQMMVVFVFAELSVVYPLAGALYQWARRLVGYRYGWFVGWIYGWALLVTIASIDLGVAPYIIDLLDVEPSTTLFVVIAIVMATIHTIINLLGVKVTAIVTNLGLIVEVGMTVVLGGVILFGPGPHQSPELLVSKETYNGYVGNYAPAAAFLPALLAQAFIFFGFESAADVSEEIVDAKKSVPRAMILSLSGAALVTAFLEVALVLGIPDISVATSPATCATNATIPYILQAHLGRIVTRLLGGLLVIAYVSCAGAVQAATARLLFSFARDDQLPLSDYLKTVNPKTKVPVMATLCTAFIPMLVILTNFISLGNNLSMVIIITNYAVIGIYCAFQAIIIGRIYAYFSGKFRKMEDDKYFSLGNMSLIVSFLALIYGVSMIVNLLWPRPYDSVTGWLSIIITVVIFGSGMILIAFFVKQKGTTAGRFDKEDNSPLLNY